MISTQTQRWCTAKVPGTRCIFGLLCFGRRLEAYCMAEKQFLLALFAWAPRPLIVLALLAVAISVAVMVHLLLWSIFQRFFGARYPFVREIVVRTRAISNFAFIMVAVSAAVPLAPLQPHV